MPKTERFTFLCDTKERQAISELAERLRRSESDAVRWVVTEAARELQANPPIKAAELEADHA